MIVSADSRLPKHKLRIISIIILGIVVICAIWFIFYTKRLGDPAVIQQEQTQSVVTHTLYKVITPAQSTIITSGYTLPPIENGMVPVITSLTTDQKIVFLGIDDGAVINQSVVDMIQENHIKASLYVLKGSIAINSDLIKQIVALGSLVENHSLSHDTSMVTSQTYDQQKNEICGMADYVQQQFGRRPIFFRLPGGAYSNTMRRAAADCGMKAIVTWIAKANGGSMQYQIGNQLRPGDVVLMHFRPEFAQDMQAFIDAMTAAGLHTELLEDLIAS